MESMTMSMQGQLQFVFNPNEHIDDSNKQSLICAMNSLGGIHSHLVRAPHHSPARNKCVLMEWTNPVCRRNLWNRPNYVHIARSCVLRSSFANTVHNFMHCKRISHANIDSRRKFKLNAHFSSAFFCRNSKFQWSTRSPHQKPKMNTNRLRSFSSQSIDLEQRKRNIFTTSKYCRRQNGERETREVEHPTNARKQRLEPTAENDVDERVVPSRTNDSQLMRNGYFQWKTNNVNCFRRRYPSYAFLISSITVTISSEKTTKSAKWIKWLSLGWSSDIQWNCFISRFKRRALISIQRTTHWSDLRFRKPPFGFPWMLFHYNVIYGTGLILIPLHQLIRIAFKKRQRNLCHAQPKTNNIN